MTMMMTVTMMMTTTTKRTSWLPDNATIQ